MPSSACKRDSGCPLDLDLKIGIVLGRGFLLVDAADVGEARAFAQRRGQVGKFIGRPGGVYLHAPIVQIAHVAGHTQRVRHALCVDAITDALHAPTHEVEPPNRTALPSPPRAVRSRDNRRLARAHARGRAVRFGGGGTWKNENSMMKMLQNGERTLSIFGCGGSSHRRPETQSSGAWKCATSFAFGDGDIDANRHLPRLRLGMARISMRRAAAAGTVYLSNSSRLLASSTRSLKSFSSDAGSAASFSVVQAGKAPKCFSICRRRMVSSPS